MSEPSDPSGTPAADAPFDPYRYGRPEHPVPPEYAPPGYQQPQAPPSYAPPPTHSGPYQAGPYQAGPNQAPYGPGPYPPGPYPPGSYPGAPPPPAFHGYQQPRTGNGKATAALVLGLLSIFFCWLSVFDVIFVALAVVFGLIALGEARRSGRDQGQAQGQGQTQGRGRGLAIAGLSCAIVGALLATILTVKIVKAADRCGGFSHTGVSNSDFRQCVSDNF